MVVALERISNRGRRTARLLVPAIAVTLAAALGAGLSPARASAGQYHVYSCRTPAGESAPTDSWTASKAGAEAVTEDSCSEAGGALVAGLRADTPRTANSTVATWAFAAPAGETLAGATLWRAGDVDGGWALYGTYQFWLAGPSETKTFRECLSAAGCPGVGDLGQPMSTENRVLVQPANLGPHLYVSASCGGIAGYSCPEGSGDANGYAAVEYLYAADLTLEQSAPPSVAGVSGELASAQMVSGTSDVAFGASDPGAGVYEAVFSVDGQQVQNTVVEEDGGRCRNVGQTTDGLAAFLYVQPCPASVSADVGFDTTRVSNGTHHLVVSVIDAAGNAATVLDREITVDNPPAPGGARGPNGTNASTRATLTVGWKRHLSERLTGSYGRAETIVGRLTGPGGVPIDGARIDVVATPAYAEARGAAMASPVTAPDGRFSLLVPAGASSRTLRFSYRSDFGAPPVATKTLALRVRASVTLRIAPRTVSVGRSVYFSGRLRGGPIPEGGKLLVLEARSPRGAWLEFDVIRSDARGRYRASYRFKFPGPAAYQFRVLCEAEADFPFATGSSTVVGVQER